MTFLLRLLILSVLISLSNNTYSFAQVSPTPIPTTPPTIAPIPTIPAPGTVTPSQTQPSILPAPTSPERDLGQQTFSDYRFKLIASPAKGWYEPRSGQLVWVPPTATNNEHIEVYLINAIDQRELPNAGVTVTIYDTNNRMIETKPLIMLWSRTGYHYGNNFTIPVAGNYNVRVDVTPPLFARHNKQIGNRFFSPARVNFTNVALRPEGRLNE